MYAKLAFRNIRRSLRDYIIYFVTLTLTAALMYSFLALGLSPDILAMTENMSMLTTGILILSALPLCPRLSLDMLFASCWANAKRNLLPMS